VTSQRPIPVAQRPARTVQAVLLHTKAMKTTTILGIMLIVLGVVAFAYKGISYTTRENVIDVGPLQATVDKKEAIPLSPFVAGLAIISGIALLIVGVKKA